MSTSRADSYLPSFSVNTGISLEIDNPGTLNDFWTAGLGIGAGIRLPFSISREYNQFRFNLNYNYFPFDNNATFPIGSFQENSRINLSGKSVHVFTIIIDNRTSFFGSSKTVIPYVSFGFGFLGRSKTEMSSDSTILPSIETGYKGAGLFAISVGGEFKVVRKVILTLEIKYIQGNTFPGKTTFAPIIMGISF
jgi:hypothetical protein